MKKTTLQVSFHQLWLQRHKLLME